MPRIRLCEILKLMSESHVLVKVKHPDYAIECCFWSDTAEDEEEYDSEYFDLITEEESRWIRCLRKTEPEPTEDSLWVVEIKGDDEGNPVLITEFDADER